MKVLSISKGDKENSLKKINKNEKLKQIATQSGSKSILSEKASYKLNQESTCIQGSDQKGPYQLLYQNLSSQPNSHAKSLTQFSKSKSHHQFSSSQKKSHQNHTPLKSNQYQNRYSLSVSKNSPCKKHQPLFFCSQQFTFQPQINPELSEEIYPQGPKKDKISKEKKFQRLIEDLRRKQLQRFEQKVRKNNEEFKELCPFVPNGKKKIQTTQDIHQKLFNQSKQLQQRHQSNQQKKLSQQDDLLQKIKSQQLFRYKQSKRKWSMYLNTQKHKDQLQKPIHERIQQIREDKRKQMENLTVKYYHQQSREQTKFTKQQTQSMVKRLVEDYRKQKEQEIFKRQNQVKKILKQTCTFEPKVNKDDLHRQKLNDQARKKQKSPTYQVSSFVPSIDQMSNLIASKILSLNPQNVITRLHNSTDQQTKKISQLTSQIYSECTFKPQINQISKQLVYLSPSQPFTHKCDPPESLFRQEQQMTFKPQINMQSQCMTWVEKHDLLIKKKEKSMEKLGRIENQKQYKEIEECTFVPETISTKKQWKLWKENNLKKNKLVCNTTKLDSSSRQKQPIVRGIDKYLKNCQNIKRKKQNHEERLNKIFNFQKKYDQRIQKERKSN